MSSPTDPIIHVLLPRLADRKRKGGGAPWTDVLTRTTPQTKRPNLYRVLLLNDDYTPMDFVVHILEHFFNKDHETANQIMMRVAQFVPLVSSLRRRGHPSCKTHRLVHCVPDWRARRQRSQRHE
jgi:hypothetical protein